MSTFDEFVIKAELAGGSPEAWKRALFDVTDTAHACKVWFETQKIAATAADIAAMTKLALERAVAIEQGQITEYALARKITGSDEQANLSGPLTQGRGGLATLVAGAPESCFPAPAEEEDPEMTKAQSVECWKLEIDGRTIWRVGYCDGDLTDPFLEVINRAEDKAERIAMLVRDLVNVVMEDEAVRSL
jgi:hypothetical protein